MRIMLKIKVPTEIGNRAINDGSLGRILEDTVSKLKAEAAYFVAQNGMRCAMIFFDMKDSSEIPVIAEPLFIGLGTPTRTCTSHESRRSEKGAKDGDGGNVGVARCRRILPVWSRE